jgi:hypothetical protein
MPFCQRFFPRTFRKQRSKLQNSLPLSFWKTHPAPHQSQQDLCLPHPTKSSSNRSFSSCTAHPNSAFQVVLPPSHRRPPRFIQDKSRRQLVSSSWASSCGTLHSDPRNSSSLIWPGLPQREHGEELVVNPPKPSNPAPTPNGSLATANHFSSVYLGLQKFWWAP